MHFQKTIPQTVQEYIFKNATPAKLFFAPIIVVNYTVVFIVHKIAYNVILGIQAVAPQLPTRKVDQKNPKIQKLKKFISDVSFSFFLEKNGLHLNF